jgi:hypothetical protein
MKKLLLSIILSCPLIAAAQKYELGLSGGFNYCAKPAISLSPEFPVCDVAGKGGYVAGISITRNLYPKKAHLQLVSKPVWQIGIKLDVQQIRCGGKFQEWQTFIYDPLINPPRQTIHLAEPAISPLLFVNRRVNFRKSYVYFGACAGPTFAISSPEKSDYYTTYMSGGKGYTIGGQIGYSHDISPRFGLNAELAARYYSVKVNTGTSNWTDIVAPITIGIRYNIGKIGVKPDNK